MLSIGPYLNLLVYCHMNNFFLCILKEKKKLCILIFYFMYNTIFFSFLCILFFFSLVAPKGGLPKLKGLWDLPPTGPGLKWFPFQVRRVSGCHCHCSLYSRRPPPLPSKLNVWFGEDCGFIKHEKEREQLVLFSLVFIFFSVNGNEFSN